jgi:sugar phosphate permease
MKSILVEFNASRAAAFFGISIACAVAGVSGTLAGILSDRYGSRVVLSIGGILHGLALCSVSLINNTWQFYLAYGILASFFSSFVGIMPIISVLSNWFKNRDPFAGRRIHVGSGGTHLGKSDARRGRRNSHIRMVLGQAESIYFKRDPASEDLWPPASAHGWQG